MNECVWFVATLDLSLLTLVITTFPLLAHSLALPSLAGRSGQLIVLGLALQRHLWKVKSM